MKYEIKDFIGVFSDVYPEGFCQHLMSEFDRNQELGIGADRQVSENSPKHEKNDYQICSNGHNILFTPFENHEPTSMFFKGLQDCFSAYTNEFSSLKGIKMVCRNIKMQKTSAGGGYHVWHAEQGNGPDANRGLAYMLYLNTLPVESNGETEFLYQQRRINPVENTMVLWPAAFTHLHRGNPVYGDDAKYIVTGWFFHE
jgi:hypothetical protein